MHVHTQRLQKDLKIKIKKSIRGNRLIQSVKALAAAVMLTITMYPQAAAQQVPEMLPGTEGNSAYQVASNHQDRRPIEPSFNDNVVDNDAGAGWKPTENPQGTVIPGKMRSDREGVPAGFTKEEADRAEIQEAQEQSGIQTFSAAESTNCRTYWPSTFKVCGEIRKKYDAMGGPKSYLTWPKSDELGVPDGVGRRNEFINGFIYWHPEYGAHSVTTHFSFAWARTGWERGEIGYPISEEYALPDGSGRKQTFSKGHIYGSLSGIVSIHGAIYDKWSGLGSESGELGYPITDETGTSDGQGRFNVFNNGVIYWTPASGAYEVAGLMLEVWMQNGLEKGRYGYPTSSSYTDEQGEIVQNFQGGVINLTQEINQGNVTVGEKPMSALLVSSLTRRMGQDFGRFIDSLPPAPQADIQVRAMTTAKEVKDGGVSIPSRYNYDPNAGSLRDYCTKSPDYFYVTGDAPNADFRGPCARHDICYFDVANSGGGSARYADCNRRLRDDLLTVCGNVYSDRYSLRKECEVVARTYYEAVVSVHPSHWWGHVTS